jgi:hypothetical protein
MLSKLKILSEQLMSEFPGATARLDSGADSSRVVFLDLTYYGRDFVLEYIPGKEEFGVSENLESDGFNMGHQNVFSRYEEAQECLRRLLKAAKCE